MKNYKTLKGLFRFYIQDENNKCIDGSDAWGENIWYWKTCKVQGIYVYPMVNIKTKNAMLRFDPIDDEQYELFNTIWEQYGKPAWICLS